MLVNDEIDIGLVPVAIIPELKDITSYLIIVSPAMEKLPVSALFSDVPLEEIKVVSWITKAGLRWHF